MTQIAGAARRGGAFQALLLDLGKVRDAVDTDSHLEQVNGHGDTAGKALIAIMKILWAGSRQRSSPFPAV